MKRLSYYIKKLLTLFLIYFIMFLIVFFSRELADGVRNGISVATNLVLPSMFIFMIFSNAVIRSKYRRIFSLPFRFLGKHLFRISDSYTAIVVLSLVGGYPVGAKLLGDAVRRKEMSPETAERMLCYCVNCGPAFLISGVGASIFGSMELGILLCVSQIAACLAVGFCTSFTFQYRGGFSLSRIPAEHFGKSRPSAELSGAELLVSSVNDAVKSLGIICGFVAAFSSLTPVLSVLLKDWSAGAVCLIQGLLEVTTGCNQLAASSSLNHILLAALFTSFGGICVHLQICAMLKSTGIRMKRFFIYRLVYVSVSLAVVKLAVSCIPGVSQCISINHTIPRETCSVSPAATVFLLILGVMLLFFRKKSVTLEENTAG